MVTIAFFNNKGGVGKTSLVYHLAWMYADLGHRVIAADLDPQANLTAMFLDEERLEELWPDEISSETVFGAVRPLLQGLGDVGVPHIEEIASNLGLLAGDLGLSSFEDELSAAWPECLDRKERAFRVMSAFYRLIQNSAQKAGATIVLVDVGPNLGAINRAALLAADFVAVPLAPDLFSLQGLKNLGPTLRQWRAGWQKRLNEAPTQSQLPLPQGRMTPAGYVVLQHAVRGDRPVRAYARWMERIPRTYRDEVLQSNSPVPANVQTDANCLAMLKNYRSLMPLAQDAHKPMFFLKPADGALGGHMAAVQGCYRDFHELASRLLAATNF